MIRLANLNDTDREILRRLIKRNNESTPFSHLLIDSPKFLGRMSYHYLKSRIDLLEAGDILVCEKVRPLKIKIKTDKYYFICNYILALMQSEEI